MNDFLISAGVGSWFGFTGPLLISVFAYVVKSLAPLSKSSRKYSALAACLRIAIWAFSIFGILGFAAFYGQLSPSKDVSAVFMFVGAAVYYLSFFCYRKLEKHVASNGT